MNTVGRRGEKYVSRVLIERGYTIVGHNVYVGKGEIDIIATKGAWVYFVEVKTVTCDSSISPGEQMSTKKVRKFIRASERYARSKSVTDFSLLFAAVVFKDKHVHSCSISRL